MSTAPEEGAAGGVQAAEVRAAEVLEYILLHRARSHHFDLRAELAEWRGRDSLVTVPTGDIRSKPRYRYDVLMQVAVEFHLQREPLSRLCDADPAFLRFAYDALYYVSRLWEEGQSPCQLSMAEFDDYLTARAQSAGENGLDAPAGQVELPISTSAKTELFHVVRVLCRSLTKPAELVLDIQEFQKRSGRELFSENVLDVIRNLDGPLKFENETLLWKHDFWGRPLDLLQLTHFLQGGGLEQSRALIDDFDRSLVALGLEGINPASLAEKFHILPLSPAWSSVQESLAIAGEAARRDEPSVTASDSIAIIRGYEALQQGNLPTIAQALFCGWLLGARMVADPTQPDSHQRAPALGLGLLESQLGLERRDPTETREQIRNIALKLLWLHPELPAPCGDLLMDPPHDLEGWRHTVNWLSTALRMRGWKDAFRLRPVAEAGWKEWRDRFDDQVPWTRDYVPEAVELLTAATKTGPAAIFTLGPAEASLFEWSSALLAALVNPGSTDRPPLWLTVPALLTLGFGSAIGPMLNALQSDFPTNPDELALARSWAGRLPPSTTRERQRRALLLIDHPDMVRQWRSVLPGDAALVLRTEDAKALVAGTKGIPPSIVSLLRFDRVALEISGSEADLQKLPSSPSDLLQNAGPEVQKSVASLPMALILSAEPKGKWYARQPFVIVQPAKVEDILSAAAAWH